jgi:hypothetical protein
MTTAALLVGDIAHNLKCALDYAWIETTRRALPEILDEYTRFPIRSTRDELESTLKGRKIDVIHPRLFGLVLDEIKPYDRDGNFAIWPIYVLDRQDKHRLLIPLVQYSNIRDIQLQDHTGNLVRGETWSTTTAPPYRVDFRFDVDIKHEGKLTLSIAIDETLIQYAPSIKGLFSIYSRFIVEIVESLERFVKTA